MTSQDTAFDTIRPLIDQALDTHPHNDTENQARLHQNDLLKPQGSLGRLEEIALWIAAWHKNPKPQLKKRHALVFAGNHGVISQNPQLSAFPIEVTHQMILNFAREKAAINQLCQLYNISLDVHPFNLDEPSQDFTQAPALSDENFSLALLEGAKRVPESADILCLGEMGIGNTTAAAALAFALHFKNTSDNPLIWCGKGTGISQEQQQYKALIVKNAVEFHAPSFLNLPPHIKPISILQRLGGFEFVALTGAILKARILRIPTITDGYAASMPLAILHAINPELISHVRVAHLSQEPGHAQILSSLNISPLLDLNLRLGEASGAALATTLCDAALACHNHMGTFSETLTAQKL